VATPYAWGMRDLAMGSAAASVMLGVAARWTVDLYLMLKEHVRGLDFISIGLACFALALGVSYLKARRRISTDPPPAAETPATETPG
jgi:hypothetical protein